MSGFTFALQLLADDPSAPLDAAEVAMLLAADEYADLSIETHVHLIDLLAAELSPQLHGTLETRVATLAEFLFEEKGFQGNGTDYYDPCNSYLNQVLERRLGIPITLSVLAMAVGNRAGLNVYGVGLPGHFIAKAAEGDEEVLFDPFNGGQLLTPAACSELIEAVTGRALELAPGIFDATPLGLIIMRMLNNLKTIYLRNEDFPRAVRTMERLLILAPDDVFQRRDLGVSLIRVDRPGAAVEHLTAYLNSHPSGDEAELVKQVLQQARNEVARWN